ncbi:prolyl oligopeptidase family serine peptidase [Devosia rhodophyticola]|uniref:Prolyl oligopeptidase family serine peptidase n=1 Tax=Devosia rhodophyticola TaxID=3026423 RepID=A0ABY7YTQ2_9HYPH|nr:prolyl oligopeptidase family serine peptidase [Devosia rhodophyticola]WDR04636.1 prolyl oligopeptidase family serine peptidase [Devosia rhodophyticola]
MPKLSGPMMPPLSGGDPKQAVILLHGYGSDGNDLIGLAPHWRDMLADAVFIAPNAPEQVPGHPSGYQWFAPDFEADSIAMRQKGLHAAAPVLGEFLSDFWTQSGLGAQDTILAGFSQGAMMALHFGLSLPEPLMGVLAFSGLFQPADNFGAENLPKPPVAIVHGDMDTVVPFSLGEAAAATLTKAGYAVKFHNSAGVGHGIAPDGLAFAADFIGGIIPNKKQR